MNRHPPVKSDDFRERNDENLTGIAFLSLPPFRPLLCRKKVQKQSGRELEKVHKKHLALEFRIFRLFILNTICLKRIEKPIGRNS